MATKEVWEIILKFLEIILSFPTVFLIISLVFIRKFRESIKLFLENIASVKVGPFEASQRQVNVPKEKINDQKRGITLNKEQIQRIDEALNSLSKEKESKEAEIGNQNEIIKYLTERAELNEFAYLSLYLVNNSKLALSWFNSQVANSSTKENFIAQFALPPQIINPLAEKEAIFNALLVNDLIEQTGVLFKTSDKGVRFLKHIKFI
ncbi:MAG: hypothetical protein NTY11_01535 [Candidatus Parcubacteria bacterium]|nr:hypothetical protein [Candidatus Parcubacteria bacterium]